MNLRSTSFFCPVPKGPGEGSKGQISFNSNYKVNFRDFYSKLCVLTNERYKTYQTDFLISGLGHDPQVGLWGTGGAQGDFFQTWSCGISNRQG